MVRFTAGWGPASFALGLTLGLAACVPHEQALAARTHPTIVSLNPCSDAVLAQVAAPGQLLAISHYSQDPASTSMDLNEAARFATTTGTVEEIAALAPDMVVAGAYLDPATAHALSRLGIKVVTLPIAANVAQAEQQVRDLAMAAGEPAAGEEMIERIDRALARARPPVGSRSIPALVWESGGIVAGNDTLIADLLLRTGFVNAAAARGLAQASYLPLERVIAQPPRVIFAVGSPAAEEDRSLRHPALAALTGTTRAPLDGSLLWCGGPTIPRALERLAQVRAGLGKAT
ncbi:iron complex transport system substrate-binding protein [Novosphingobium sp. Rr 2-17]|uniref:ABC transporter substrate-binding protein n=1 Tax=Novosphingobium sp. Rr 2-17 TaxID=555793 RepID=UPI0002699E6A|nr:helical backbone metal receptor [Novosphingobium sp. Rr 2-17]EIZ80829.1 iron complex transport system substrate-binding protein [Novosphingobium sp. Rr 2-17]